MMEYRIPKDDNVITFETNFWAKYLKYVDSTNIMNLHITTTINIYYIFIDMTGVVNHILFIKNTIKPI